MGGGASSAGGATAEETQRLKEQIDAAEKRAAKAEQEYKDAVAKHSEVEKQNKELTELAANFGASNERAKALAQAELVNMAKVWRAQRAVDECKGKKQVSQDRLEFWQDALNIAVNKRKDMEFSRSDANRNSVAASQEAQDSSRAAEAAKTQLQEAEAAAAEALRVAEECRRKEKEVFMASFQCDSFLAAAETAIEASSHAEQDAQELIAKREAELQSLQEAIQKANERLQQVQSHKHEKLQEKERLKGDKDAKQAELQEAEAERKRAEEQLQEADQAVENAKKMLLEAQKDLETKVGLEQSFTVKQRTFQHFAMEAEQIERTTKQEVLNSEDHSKKAHEALQVAEGLLQEQNQESKQLEVRLREEASKGDHKAAMDAAAIAAARALLELVPFKDPSQSVPNHTEAPSVFTEAYNQNRTDESRHRANAGAAGIEEEPASPASPASPDSPEAVPAVPEEKAPEGDAAEKEE